MKNISEERWRIAQKDEREYWEKSWKKNLRENEDFSERYWKYHQKILLHFTKISKEKKILEIGGGASPLICYLPKAHKNSLDPLMDYYIKNFKFSKGIRYIKGKGEELPFKNDFFDLVIITNVIDHVHNYKKVLSEIKRTLKKSGVVYLSVDCHNFLLKKYRDFRESIGAGDPAHPHTFTLKNIKKELEKSGFRVIHLQEGIGNLGAYASKMKPRDPILEKIKFSLKEGGMPRLINSIFYRTLNKIGNFTSKEKEGADFIFILKKQ